jgi:hypothetical protein
MILFTPGTRCPRLNVIRKLRDRIDVSTGSGMAKPKLERWQATYAEGNSTYSILPAECVAIVSYLVLLLVTVRFRVLPG